MIIVCPSCKRQHKIDEARLSDKVKAAKCIYCGHKFPLPRPQDAQTQDPKGGDRGGPKMRRIAVSLSKGGVGKTTTAVNLAAGLALAGHKVLLVDTDTQGQAAYMLGVKPKAGLTELMTGEVVPEDCMLEARERLWLLAGGKSLAGVKRLIARKDFRSEMMLSEALSPYDDRFDYVIIDTSPGWDVLTINVLFYANEVLIPVSLEAMAIQGLLEFCRSLASVQAYHKELSLKYVVPTFMDKRVKQSEEIYSQLEAHFNSKLCPPVRYNVRLSEAPGHGQTIYEYAPGSPGAKDYRELVRKVSGNEKLWQ
ncbi:chromosome partitioning protein [Desulfacinum hydrothermale DSM 13146]|uniref:Chromosome partitioning protein n=1 Tax=Desulfacinum hydrothermale DSM 13146 TaxID=1121390 RepID=A0A1W1XLZ7_9BACT|nr:AAA family ATPase [Desulfacinum hydrothermale]SMC24874.1 chromosome partitioning protein [Desulfacinum hydrothermale DSM 13146]